MKPETWLKRAVRRKTDKPYRPELTEIHCQDGYTMATDTHRIHLYHGDLGLPPVKNFPSDPFGTWPTQCELKIRISTDHLLLVAKNAIAVGRPHKDEGKLVVMKMTFGEFALTTELIGKEATHRTSLHPDQVWKLGKRGVKTPFVYSCEGGSLSFGIQPRFLKDAIWGMAPEVDIWLSAGMDRILIKSDASKKIDAPVEAVIMMCSYTPEYWA